VVSPCFWDRHDSRRCNDATKGRFHCPSERSFRRRLPTRRDPHGAIASIEDRFYEDLLQALMPSNEKQAALKGSFASVSTDLAAGERHVVLVD
jgi:hypothetical protein